MAARAAPLNLSSFGAVDRVVFDGNSVGNGGFTLDNFVFNQKVKNTPLPFESRGPVDLDAQGCVGVQNDEKTTAVL